MKRRLLVLLDAIATLLFPIGVMVVMCFDTISLIQLIHDADITANTLEKRSTTASLKSLFIIAGVLLHVVVLHMAVSDEDNEYIPAWALLIWIWMNRSFRLSQQETSDSNKARRQ